MDWGNVTAQDLVDALREVDWSSPPRPVSEFFSRFAFPRSYSKWSSRLKCNLYYYRTNYFIVIIFILGSVFGVGIRLVTADPDPGWINSSGILWIASCSLLTVLWAFVIGLLATLLHASFRMPNLKARLNTFREEFRAVWRNYSEL
ncbi:hypothetical protein Taro_014035 [Colocasia esculenta]|uniref:PRA1 family protein n=1 Tax=Colocasia esculenta TaxID=4460 RepID=A0A843UHV1_COLES|nr:hypothetical protein [Colocasia esculenta]